VKDIHQAITDRFIAELEKGHIPWQRPWQVSHPCNLISGKPYRGINALMTGYTPFVSPYWLTFKQAQDLGGKILPGSKATPIVFWKLWQATGSDGQPLDPTRKPVPFLRYSNVFNLEQTEGIEAPHQAETSLTPPLEAANEIAAKTNIPISMARDKAAWDRVLDVVYMPPMSRFQSEESYYHVLFHELAHATGHPKRLDRPGCTPGVKYGSPIYAKEELIAELSACFLSNQAGIMKDVNFSNSVGYVQSWLQALQNDNQLVLGAASQAQKAVAYINGESQDQREDIGETEAPSMKVAMPPPLPTPHTAEKPRIREDLPEARPILARMNEIMTGAAARNGYPGQSVPPHLLTNVETEELHALKMRLRCKTPEEARADLLKKRQARTQAVRPPRNPVHWMSP
jgi:antirestriction protein ArdC